jgi:hypothetical protein
MWALLWLAACNQNRGSFAEHIDCLINATKCDQIQSMIVINKVTPKAEAKLKPQFNKQNFGLELLLSTNFNMFIYLFNVK